MQSEQDAMNGLLRAGLRAIDTPPISLDFDDRVLAAVSRSAPWWERSWRAALPVCSTGLCSFGLVALAAFSVFHLPVSNSDGAPSTPAAMVVNSPAHQLAAGLDGADTMDWEALLGNRGLLAASIAAGPIESNTRPANPAPYPHPAERLPLGPNPSRREPEVRPRGARSIPDRRLRVVLSA